MAGTLWQRGSLKSETEISRLTRKCREKQLVWRGLKDVGSFSLKVTLTNGQSYRIHWKGTRKLEEFRSPKSADEESHQNHAKFSEKLAIKHSALEQSVTTEALATGALGFH